MENLKNILQNKITKKDDEKSPKYKWQQQCLDIIDDLQIEGKDKGVVWRLWTHGGYPLLSKIQADIEEGIVKNPIPYLLWKLKSYK